VRRQAEKGHVVAAGSLERVAFDGVADRFAQDVGDGRSAVDR
jgi:hypothetical protein